MFTVKLNSVSWENKNVGTKAANIGELIKVGVSVPAGFVVTSDAFDKFMKVNKIDNKMRNILAKMNMDDMEDVYNHASQIQKLIIEAEFPDFIRNDIRDQYEELSIGQNAKEIGKVALDIIRAGREHEPIAVRPSPLVNDIRNSSYSGQLSYYLNVAGIENLLSSIKKVWASLFSPRIIFYRKTRNIEGILLMGVVVQKMLNPEKSGVVYTSDPVTNDTNKIIIESSWGLADSVIYESVNSDNYFIDKQSGTVVSKNVGNKTNMRVRDPMSGGTKVESVIGEKINQEVLETHEVNKLIELAKKIENNYNGQPQNIEWCSERNRIFIVESKPLKSDTITYQEVNTSMPSVLSGTPISRGSVEGKVRVVLGSDEMRKIEQGDILVTKNILPDMIPIMGKIAGIVTEEGSYTGYTSVISREFGVPCLIKAEKATSLLRDEQSVLLDAFKGTIYSNDIIREETEPEISTIPEPESTEMQSEPSKEALQEQEITGTEIMLNVSSPNIDEASIQDSDGIGVFRSEHILTSMGRRPITLSRTNPEELINIITSSLDKFSSKQIWYRSFDALTDEFEDYTEYEAKEKNPILGWHGIRRSLDQEEILKCEIEALRRMQSKGMSVGLLLPLVTNEDEIRRIKEMIDVPIKLGISIDTPATALNIDVLCREVDYVSINLSLLTQLTLGVDSENSKISRYYSELNPAVLSLIRSVVKTCKNHGVRTSISNTSFDPKMIEEFIKIGVDVFSVEGENFHEIKSFTSRIERRLILEKLRNQD